MDYIFPVKDYLTITQGFKSSHLGIDMGWTSAHSGQAIIASEEGTVYQRADGWGNTYNGGKGKRIYGNYVILKHADGNYTVYGHMAKGIVVSKGQLVKKGQVLGYMGNSGFSNGQHLHYEFRKNGFDKSKYAVDPLNYVAVEDPTLIISEKTLFPDKIKFRKTTWGTPVERNNKVNQVKVIATQLRARLTPSLSGEVLGMVNVGIYNVKQIKEADGYKWYSVEDFWFADNGSWCEYLPKAEPKYNMTMYALTEAQKKTMASWCEAQGVKYDAKQA